MGSEELALEEKCENLMNIVVESRKKFGKLSVEYDSKFMLLENKLLTNRLEAMSNYHFKTKQPFASVDYGQVNRELEGFRQEIQDREVYIERLNTQIANTTLVVRQLKRDSVAKKTRGPITTEVLLARAKDKLT